MKITDIRRYVPSGMVNTTQAKMMGYKSFSALDDLRNLMLLLQNSEYEFEVN